MKKTAVKNLLVILLFTTLFISGCSQNNRIDYPDGSRYIGEIANGKPNGKGTLITSGETVYSGNFEDVSIVGEGTADFKDLGTYVGEFNHLKLEGKGKFTYLNGDEFEGYFTDNMRSNGTYTTANGYIYKGTYKDGKKHGKGVETSPNGDTYSGDYFEDYWHGKGTFETNGVKYIGDFEYDYFNGNGKILTADGKEIVAKFEDGLTVGKCTVTYKNGDIVVGEMVNLQLTGSCKVTLADGSTYTCVFADGKPVK